MNTEQIETAHQQLTRQGATKAERQQAAAELQRLHKLRSPQQVKRLEQAKGLVR